MSYKCNWNDTHVYVNTQNSDSMHRIVQIPAKNLKQTQSPTHKQKSYLQLIPLTKKLLVNCFTFVNFHLFLKKIAVILRQNNRENEMLYISSWGGYGRDFEEKM